MGIKRKIRNTVSRLFDRWKKKPAQKVPSQARVQRDVALTDEEFWRRAQADVKAGRRHDPLKLTDSERHYATRELTQGMKWSDDFVYRMRTPMHRQLLETGKAVNLVGGVDYAGPEVYRSEEELHRKALVGLIPKPANLLEAGEDL